MSAQTEKVPRGRRGMTAKKGASTALTLDDDPALVIFETPPHGPAKTIRPKMVEAVLSDPIPKGFKRMNPAPGKVSLPPGRQGGNRIYAKIFLASPRERIGIIRGGVPAVQLVDTVSDMGVTKESLFSTLQFPRATINRKIAAKDVLPPEFSERMVGLQKLIGQVEVMVEQSGNPENFNAAHWLAQWLNEPLPALGNEKPAAFMDTVEGQEMISNLLLKMQTGAYA